MTSHKFCIDNVVAFQFKLPTFYNTMTQKQISYVTNLWKLYINKSLCFSEMASMWNLCFILFKAEKW